MKDIVYPFGWDEEQKVRILSEVIKDGALPILLDERTEEVI
jgi:hypothetical protein